MRKLYKKDGEDLLYWETWDDDGKHIMHWGTVGDEGETQAVRSGLFRDAEKTVAEEMARREQDGYAEIDEEDLQTVIVEYRIGTWEREEEVEAHLERRYEIQDLMDNALGWTGLGHCDGGSIGSGTMEVCCLVVDAKIAAPVMVQALKKAGQLEGAVIARERDDGFEALYPSENGPTSA
ncbi:MAG: hypothetical protein QNJ30_24015 [Kiloniellales bacterium]|nr:hypothetical protein [Kiloniellales bacterium]